MPTPLSALMDRLADRRALRRWRRASRGAASLPLRTLQAERLAARALRDELGRWLHLAEGRLAVPLHGASSMPRPLHCDWSLRPEIWSGPVDPPGLAAVATRTGFGREATVFHDCATSEITLRQVRNQRESDLAPFGLRMDVFGFDGSYLSLVIDLPDSAVQGLKLRHIVRLDVAGENAVKANGARRCLTRAPCATCRSRRRGWSRAAGRRSWPGRRMRLSPACRCAATVSRSTRPRWSRLRPATGTWSPGCRPR
ncbi:MAG: DUF6478 family protein [Pseudomonadota bacterium]